MSGIGPNDAISECNVSHRYLAGRISFCTILSMKGGLKSLGDSCCGTLQKHKLCFMNIKRTGRIVHLKNFDFISVNFLLKMSFCFTEVQ